MIYVFYFFAAALVFLGGQSLRGGISYLNFFKRELARPKSDYTPFCSIIAPCRGLESGLRENLAALFRQDFPHYEIVFVVDDERDASVEIIKTLMSEPPALAGGSNRIGRKLKIEDSSEHEFNRSPTRTVPTKLVVAGRANGESQKVHNLRQAVLEIADESEVLVFVDSDVRPDENWLRNLVAPLESDEVGCATGYRWFISKKFGFAAELRSVWNASIASALGANLKNNFCWGGALAVRRDVFERIEMREFWRGTLSDDFAVTRRMNELNLPIRFVPQCLTATVENCTFREFIEFSTRQMKITRVYAPHLWKASLIGSIVFSTVFWMGIGLLFFLTGWYFWLTCLFVWVIFTLGASKSFLRLKAVKLVLKDYGRDLDRQIFSHLTLWIFTPPIYFYNCVCALLSRKIVWRGIEYEMKSATETVVSTTNKS